MQILNRTSILAIAIASAAMAPLGAQATPTQQATPAQAPAYKRDLPAKLVSQATVPEATAAATASAKVPGGTIQAVELENEGGKLIYSYELKVPGHRGIVEVNIDAKTGTVVNTENEGS